jgi:hypothetical protein
MEIHPVEAGLFHATKEPDREAVVGWKKQIVVFCNFVNVPKN